MAKEKSRFFISNEKIINGKFIIKDPVDVHKIHAVLRLKPGELIELVSDDGNVFLAELDNVNMSEITGMIKEKISTDDNESLNVNKLFVILAQSLPKGPKMDDIIRMNTEIGVKKFIPFESEYSVIRLKDFNSKKLDRWGKIAKEAARQSEQTAIPEINTPVSFADLLGYKADLKLLLHSRNVEDSKDIAEIKPLAEKDSTVLIAIGPEGGFSPKEIQLARENGFQIVHLNLPILRTETAGAVVSSIISY